MTQVKSAQLKKVDENGRPYVEICEGYCIRLEHDEVSDEFKEKARRELRETPENVEKGLKELRELVEADDTLYIPIEHDDFLIKFLRPTKFYAKSAYELMLRYYKFKVKYPEFCKDLLPATGKLGFEHNIVNFQPKRDQHGRRILVLQCGRGWDPLLVPINDVFRALQLGVEAAMLEPMTQVNGFIVIIDFYQLTLTQCLQCTPGYARMLMEWVQDCIPLRCKAVHIVHQPAVFNVLFAFFRPFMNSKFRKRIHFHGINWESLLEHINADCLRPFHGGTMDCEQADGKLVAQLLEESTDEFEVANVFGIVKSKRLIEPAVIVPVSGPGKIGTKYVLAKKPVIKQFT
uniref:CSON009448 protein n=1 Tax=Culicoides sonorensis TaxID=179676 RepID=A0A336MZZ1_CULSO